MHLHAKALLAAAALTAAATATAAPAAIAKEKVKAKIQDRTLTITGGNAADSIALRLAPGDPTTIDVVADRVVGQDSFARSRFDRIVVDAGRGDDALSIDESKGGSTDTQATPLNGDAGDDTITGGSSDETLVGGEGDDTVNGGRGTDTAFLGAGDDRFTWNPGDGRAGVEGQNGTDPLRFNGANIAEKINLSANGPRLRLTRDVAAITMDTDGVETVALRTLGGADTVTVGDLNGTAVNAVDTDLGNDGAADQVFAEGTAGDDNIHVSGHTQVTGLAAAVAVTGLDPADTVTVDGLAGVDTTTVDGTDASDTVQLSAATPAVRIDPTQALALTENVAVDGNGGDDTITAGNGLATLAQLTIDGGAGDYTITGGDGADRLVGGAVNDTVNGGRGSDA